MYAPAKSSGLKSASTAIVTRPCRFMGFQLNAGSSATTLLIYDNASAASGLELDSHVLSGSANSVDGWFGPDGIECVNGIYASISGTGAKFIIYYQLM